MCDKHRVTLEALEPSSQRTPVARSRCLRETIRRQAGRRRAVRDCPAVCHLESLIWPHAHEGTCTSRICAALVQAAAAAMEAVAAMAQRGRDCIDAVACIARRSTAERIATHRNRRQGR